MTPVHTDTRTIIVTRIEGDRYIATTPHVPADELRGEAEHEHDAVNQLMAQIRAHRAKFEAVGQPVPWETNVAVAADKGVIIRRIGGLWPVQPSKPITAVGISGETLPTTESPKPRRASIGRA